jgi:hypothetical protein
MTEFAKCRVCRGVALALLLAALAIASAAAQNNPPSGAAAPAQAGTPSTPGQASSSSAAAPLVPPQPAAPTVADNPGVLHQLRTWWDNTIAVFTPKHDDAGSAASGGNTGGGSAVDASKGATATATDAMKSAVEATKEATKDAASTAADAMKGAVEATKNAADAIARLPGLRVVDLRETCARAPNGAPDCATAAVNGCRGKGFSTGSPLEVRTAQVCNTKPLQSGNLEKPIGCGSEAVVIRAMCQ